MRYGKSSSCHVVFLGVDRLAFRRLASLLRVRVSFLGADSLESSGCGKLFGSSIVLLQKVGALSRISVLATTGVLSRLGP